MGIVYLFCIRYVVIRTYKFEHYELGQRMIENDKLEKLSDVPLRKQYTIQHLRSHPETCQHLRAIGFSEQTLIRTVVKNSSQIICEVHNTRIGLDTNIASDILVLSTEEIEN